MQQRKVPGEAVKRQSTGGSGKDQDTTTQQDTIQGTEMTNVGEMLLDSGTTVNMLPQELANRIVAAFDPPGAQLSDGSSYAVYCNATPPELYVTLGGVEIQTDPPSMILPLTNQNGVCLAGIGAGTKGSFILGDTFFQETVVVFDIDDKTVRFADRTDTPEPEPSTSPGIFAPVNKGSVSNDEDGGGIGGIIGNQGAKNVVLNHNIQTSQAAAPTGMPSTMGQATGGKDSENAAVI